MPSNNNNEQTIDDNTDAAPPPNVDEKNSPSPDHEDAQQESPKKRNCGRCGPTSEAGRRKSSLNALRHGACARTLILPPVESHEGWEILHDTWLQRYQPCDASLEWDFVLRTAQAEWYRLRCVREYDDFMLTTCGHSITTWTPEQLKMHDLLLRYKGNAERSFHREYRALETHYKIHNLLPKPNPDPAPEPETAAPAQPMPDFEIYPATHEEVAEIIRQKRTAPPGQGVKLFSFYPCSSV